MRRSDPAPHLPPFHIAIGGAQGTLCGSTDLRALIEPKVAKVLGDLVCPSCLNALALLEGDTVNQQDSGTA